jgi:anti-sigma B factor antagonist
LTAHFDVRVEPTVENVTRVTVWGEVDAATSEALFEALVSALSLDRTGHLAVDLANVTLLDASGIGVLLAAQNRAGMAGMTFSVHAAAGLPLEVLEITGLLGQLHGKSVGSSYDSRAEREPRRRHDR